MAKTLTRQDGDPTGKNCPNCGRPTIWDEIMVPIITDIPDAEPTGEFTETCSDCSWTAENEEAMLESLTEGELTYA